ncbi:MAG TPA: hypothetical protein VFD92_25325 [Candidatus Binatia bacterium]|nr:hypothetical protein [Candidatus Binatia bacterium]
MPELGSLIVAALLLLAIAFAGSWIIAYVTPGVNPWSLLPWFGAAALAILVAGLVRGLIARRRGGRAP